MINNYIFNLKNPSTEALTEVPTKALVEVPTKATAGVRDSNVPSLSILPEISTMGGVQ